MGASERSKAPSLAQSLARILVRQKQLSEDEAGRLLRSHAEAAHAAEPESFAEHVRRSAKVSEVELLKALSRHFGVPGIDLKQVVVALTNLSWVPRQIAEAHGIFPVVVKDDRVFLAMIDPGQTRVIEEIEFVIGRKVIPYVALESSLREVTDIAYQAIKRGEEIYIGRDAPADYLASLGLADASHSKPPPSNERIAEQSLDPSREASGIIVDRHLKSGMPSGPSSGVQDDGSRSPASEGQSGPHRRPTGARPKILVVDDEADIRALLRRVLEDQGYEVTEASEGSQALTLVREQTPDLLILDAMLPQIHGFDLCRRIKGSRRYGHIPIIMVSAVYRGWRVAEDLRQSYGVQAFIEKPFRIDDLVTQVADAIAGRAPVEPSTELTSQTQTLLQEGLQHYRAGDLENAIAALHQALAIDPLSFELHYHLGLLYGKQNQVFEAVHQLETAVDLQPRNFSALRNLAVLYQTAGFRHKSIEMWERALASAPNDDTRQGIKDHLMNLL